jgi:endonuclease YncB( thermonuclease family)
VTQGHDRYGRIIGAIRLPDGRDLNAELVRAGLAWWYRKYAPNDVNLQAFEETARKGKVGLWKDANPVAPWDYRHGVSSSYPGAK